MEGMTARAGDTGVRRNHRRSAYLRHARHRRPGQCRIIHRPSQGTATNPGGNDIMSTDPHRGDAARAAQGPGRKPYPWQGPTGALGVRSNARSGCRTPSTLDGQTASGDP